MQQKSPDPRIEAMFSGDRRWALLALAVLWASYLYIVWQIVPEATSSNTLVALMVSGGLVLLFNTASIVAMLSHYANDKDHIYGLDLHYLDINNKSRG